MPKTLKKLTDVEFNEVRRWLIDHDINHSRIHREFSDCVQVAHLLKKFYPKLIDLHNYPRRNSTELKLINWNTLNSKALKRIGIAYSKGSLEKLCKGEVGAIESVLFDIMMLERSNREAQEEKEEDYQQRIWTLNDELLMVPVNKLIGDDIMQVPQKMILFSIYEQKERESSAKDTLLVSAQQNIAHVENQLRLKTERIKDLTEQLAQLSPENTAGSSKM